MALFHFHDLFPEPSPMQSDSETATQFKVGDRVRIARTITTSAGRDCVGKLATITAIVGWRHHYSLRIDGDSLDNPLPWWDSELALEAKFKAGDRVVIARPHGDSARLDPQLRGQVATVTGRDCHGYFLDVDSGRYAWDECELDAAVPTDRPFWLVWRNTGIVGPTGYRPEPSRRHDSEQAARMEAKRLAEKHPGDEFVVVRSVASSSVEVTKRGKTTEFAR